MAPRSGCPICIPYALDFVFIKGNMRCKECGRIVRDPLEEYILSSPHLRSAPRRPNSSFERGVHRDERGIPYLDNSGKPVPIKESLDRRNYGERPTVVIS